MANYRIDIARKELWRKDPKAYFVGVCALPTPDLAKLAEASLDAKLPIAMIDTFTKYIEMASEEYRERLSHEFTEYITRIAWARRWAWDGLNVYDLTQSMVAKLLLTQADPFTLMEDLKPPFNAFRIQVPDGIFPIGMHVYREEKIVYATSIDVLFGNRTKNRTARGALDMIALPDESFSGAPGETEPMWFIRATSPVSYLAGSLMWQYPRHIYAGKTVDEARKLDFHLGGFDLPMEKAAVASAALMTFNLITAIVSGTKPHGSSRVYHRLPGRGPVSRPERLTLKTTPIDRRLIDAAKDITHGKAKCAGWKIRKRFTVRGHWRQQPYGPGRTLRRNQWIEPYWKGPDIDSEGWARIRRYGVAEGEGEEE